MTAQPNSGQDADNDRPPRGLKVSELAAVGRNLATWPIPHDRLSTFRLRLSRALDARLGGPGAAAHRREVTNATGPRLFDMDGPLARVHSDLAMLPGGLAAILLQSLHPVAMWAVSAHSSYRTDPWGRLHRTGEFLGRVSFGTVDQAHAAVDVVRSVHDRITGITPWGEAYQASDPHLLAWVHVAEVDCFLRAHQRYGARPLNRAECDRYVAEAATIAELLGASDPPRSRAELAEQLAAFTGELYAIDEARQAARYVLFPPSLSLPERATFTPVAAAAVGLLPPWARRELRLSIEPRTEAIADRVVARPALRSALTVLRWARSGDPQFVPPERFSSRD